MQLRDYIFTGHPVPMEVRYNWRGSELRVQWTLDRIAESNSIPFPQDELDLLRELEQNLRTTPRPPTKD
jgi:hypothetical protein